MRLIRLSAAPDSGPHEPDGAATLFGGAGAGFFGDARNGRRLGALSDEETLLDPAGALADFLNLGDEPPRRILVLVPGFEFEPRVGLVQEAPPASSPNPHIAIFHNREFRRGPGCAAEHSSHGTPWLRRLETQPGDLVLCFAYASDPGRISVDFARPGLASTLGAVRRRATMKLPIGDLDANLFGHAYLSAPGWAAGLAAALVHLAGATGDAPIRIMCHSLGARLTMAALTRLAETRPAALPRIDRVLMLAAALMPDDARSAAQTLSDTGAETSFFNVTSRFDRVLRNIGAPLASDIGRGKSPTTRLLRGLWTPKRIVGVHGRPAGMADIPWVDIGLSRPATRAWARAHGAKLKGDLFFSPWDHWIHFTHPGNWPLYNKLLAGGLSVEEIEAGVARQRITPRRASRAPAG